MMVRLGNFFFHYRNGLFPIAYCTLLLPSRVLFEKYSFALIFGVLIAVAGQVIRAITIALEYIVRGGKNRQVYARYLVQGGVFAHCRNPLYLGNYLIVLGLGVASNSLLFLCLAMPFFAFAYWVIIMAEETYLRNRFGAEFDAYCQRVNRVIPNWKGFGQTWRGTRFNWQRIIAKEYSSALLWPAGIIIIGLKHLWLNGRYDLSRKDVRLLWALFGFLCMAYITAWVLKKKRLLDNSGSRKASL